MAASTINYGEGLPLDSRSTFDSKGANVDSFSGAESGVRADAGSRAAETSSRGLASRAAQGTAPPPPVGQPPLDDSPEGLSSCRPRRSPAAQGGSLLFPVRAARALTRPVMLAIDVSVAAGRRGHPVDDSYCLGFRNTWSGSGGLFPLMLVHMSARCEARMK